MLNGNISIQKRLHSTWEIRWSNRCSIISLIIWLLLKWIAFVAFVCWHINKIHYEHINLVVCSIEFQALQQYSIRFISKCCAKCANWWIFAKCKKSNKLQLNKNNFYWFFFLQQMPMTQFHCWIIFFFILKDNKCTFFVAVIYGRWSKQSFLFNETSFRW